LQRQRISTHVRELKRKRAANFVEEFDNECTCSKWPKYKLFGIDAFERKILEKLVDRRLFSDIPTIKINVTLTDLFLS